MTRPRDPAEALADELLDSGVLGKGRRLLIQSQERQILGAWSKDGLLALIRRYYPTKPKRMPKLSNAQLLKSAEKYKPPQSWYDEDFSGLFSEKPPQRRRRKRK